MLVVMAVVSLLLGMTAGLLRRRASSLRLARNYARMSSRELMIGQHATRATTFGPSPLEVRMQEAHYEWGDHSQDLAARYRRAADRPWLPVGPDPPPPAWPRGVPHNVPPKVRR